MTLYIFHYCPECEYFERICSDPPCSICSHNLGTPGSNCQYSSSTWKNKMEFLEKVYSYRKGNLDLSDLTPYEIVSAEYYTRKYIHTNSIGLEIL